VAPSGTFCPEPGVAAYVDAALDAGTRVFKVHLQVGGHDPRAEELDPVWGRLAEAGVPVVVHCGTPTCTWTPPWPTPPSPRP
jgi:predicted TIM-barrel fold metal-dependent hydrolase